MSVESRMKGVEYGKFRRQLQKVSYHYIFSALLLNLNANLFYSVSTKAFKSPKPPAPVNKKFLVPLFTSGYTNNFKLTPYILFVYLQELEERPLLALPSTSSFSLSSGYFPLTYFFCFCNSFFCRFICRYLQQRIH